MVGWDLLIGATIVLIEQDNPTPVGSFNHPPFILLYTVPKPIGSLCREISAEGGTKEVARASSNVVREDEANIPPPLSSSEKRRRFHLNLK